MNNKDKVERLRQIQSAFEAVEPFLEGETVEVIGLCIERHTFNIKWTDVSEKALLRAINMAVDNKDLIEEMIKKFGLGIELREKFLEALNFCATARRYDYNILSGDWSWFFKKCRPEEPNFIEELGSWAKLVKKEAVATQPPPLAERPKLLYKKLMSLEAHEAMTGPKILDWLNKKYEINIDDATLRKTYLNPLKPYGLLNKRRIGYFIPKNS